MPSARPTIVVADDDPNARDILSRILRKAGYEVRLACDGREAMEMIHADPPDLLFLDLMMPVMNGREVLAALRLNPQWAAIPVVVVTAEPGNAAPQMGVDVVVLKPFRIADVQAAVSRALATKRLFA